MTRPDAPSDPDPKVVALPSGPAAYVDEGAGPVVLAVHGLPGSNRDFRWLAPALTAHFRVIRPDMPGFGATPWSTGRDYAPADRAAFLADLLRALELPPVIALGHSMGGVLAAALAGLAPKRVRAVALVSAPGLAPHRAFRRMPRRALSRWFEAPARARFTMPALRRAFRALGFRGPYPDEALLHTLHGVAAMDFPAHAGRLRALTKPCGVFSCQDDPLIEPAIFSALADAVPPGPRLTFETGGHNPQKHHALEIAEALRGWGL